MIEIRLALLEDVDGIAEMEARIFSDAWSRRSIEETIGRKNITVLSAWEDGTLSGYLICYHILNEGQIVRLAVDENHRRHGIADQMMRYLFAYGTQEGLSEYSLEVRESNFGAIRLYESHSFVTEGRRKNFYSDPVEDGLILWRR